MATVQQFDIVPGGVLINGVSMAADIDLPTDGTASDTKVMVKEHTDKVGIELYSASGTRAGTVEIFESNSGIHWKHGIHWKQVTFEDDETSLTVTASTEFKEFKNLNGLCSRYIYVKFTDSTSGSGAGTLYVYAFPINAT